jgi:putative FmdB family regulatory protein
MPLFDYKCKKCGHVTEFLESSGNKEAHRCEKCNSTRMEKMVSAFSVSSAGGSGAGGSPSCPTGTCSLS